MLHNSIGKLCMGREVRCTLIKQLYWIPQSLFKSNCHTNKNICGLNIWEEELNQSSKLKIEEYWKDKLQWSKFIDSSHDSKYYILSMFPYPSGNLHMGHIRVYSISDTLARFYRMNGKNVLHPMGWDAFGLPAENAAIERGLSSEVWTKSNIKTMQQQLMQLGCTFDWGREIATCDKDYYKFTQLIFLKLYEKGLVYTKKVTKCLALMYCGATMDESKLLRQALVNWDPVDKTVLAEEQVDADGNSWRSGAKVEKKILKQWFIRTTSFAKALYEGLDRKDLEDWHDIIDLQKHWIGVCDGVSFEFPLSGQKGEMTFWSDKAEHIVRAKFVAVPPGSVFDLESGKSGSRRLDMYVVNTVSGNLMPVFVTDQLPFYEGSDGRIGVPEVYECDMEFARQVGLNLSDCVAGTIVDNISERQIVSDKLNGRITSSKIRDWLISRQRRWGTPIPMVHCTECGAQPVPYDLLPVELSSLEKTSEDQIPTSCPKCGGPAYHDADTMDTFVDSSWYYLRYLDPHNQLEPFNKTAAANLMPVDIYIGGKEHAVLHLYYARFMSHFLHSLGWLPDPEPFKRLLVQGMVLGKTFRVNTSGKYIPECNVDLSGGKPVEKSTGHPVCVSWDKMSKSKYNGVDPNEMFKKYGIDTTRLLVMANAAPTSPRIWDEAVFTGVLNWQRKSWSEVKKFRNARLRLDVIPKPTDLSTMEIYMRDRRNKYLLDISTSYRVLHQFNRVITRLQILVGDLRKYSDEYRAHSKEYERALAMHMVVLSPLAPHFAAQLWSGLQDLPGLLTQEFDWTKQCHEQTWPDIDHDFKLKLTCLVNFAVKDVLMLSRQEFDQLTMTSATQLALTSPHVKLYTDQTPVLDADLKFYPGLFASIDLKLDHTKLHFEKDYYKKTKDKKKKIKQCNL